MRRMTTPLRGYSLSCGGWKGRQSWFLKQIRFVEFFGVFLVLVSIFTIVVTASSASTKSVLRSPPSLPALPLRTSGRYVVDANGNRVRFAGINWYGFDSSDFVAGGLQANTMENIIQLIVEYGFNAIRIPWSLELYEANPIVNQTFISANPSLFGLTALEILDKFISLLSANNILIMLDNHVSDAIWCCNTEDDNGLWFNQRYSTEQWIEDWKGMVSRYSSIPSFVAVDLRNEIRPNCAWYPNECLVPSWGGDNVTLDWHKAAETVGNEILKINPNLLIVVEGTWYAGDLTGVLLRPVKLDLPHRVVYEAHNYPWDFSFMDCFEEHRVLDITWGYIHRLDIAPVFLGEFGTCYTPESCVNSSAAWVDCVVSQYIANLDLDWFYWAIDGTESTGSGRSWNSTETFGLLNVTWSGPAWPEFLFGILQPLQATPSHRIPLPSWSEEATEEEKQRILAQLRQRRGKRF